MAKVDVKALGLALGIIWSATMLLMGLCSMVFDYCTFMVDIFSSLYIGYKATILGSVIGAIWGFIDAGIFGLLIGWLYNKLAK